MEHARHGFSWREFSILTFGMSFPGSSLVILSVITLERLHATLYPFRHCLIENWVYYKIIVCYWFMLLILVASGAVLSMYELQLHIIRRWHHSNECLYPPDTHNLLCFNC